MTTRLGCPCFLFERTRWCIWIIVQDIDDETNPAQACRRRIKPNLYTWWVLQFSKL